MRNVLITGGSRGIGAACVREFAKNGDRVFFIYKSSDKAAKTLSEETGAIAIKGDVSSFSDMENVVNEIKKYGRLDVLVNNAGISQIKLFQDITEKDWDEMFSVNIKGMFVLSRLFVNDMIANKKGRIINISSMWGETGGSCEVHYSAAKAAVIGFTKALAKELGPSGITVNCISPGVIATEMNSHLDEEDMNVLIEETPVGKIGEGEDIANMALYLASDKAGFITGTDIPINGGIVI